MNGAGWFEWGVVAAIVALLILARGKLRELMDDAAKGIRAFRDGL